MERHSHDKVLTGRCTESASSCHPPGYSRRKPREKVKFSYPNLALNAKTQKSPKRHRNFSILSTLFKFYAKTTIRSRKKMNPLLLQVINHFFPSPIPIPSLLLYRFNDSINSLDCAFQPSKERRITIRIKFSPENSINEAAHHSPQGRAVCLRQLRVVDSIVSQSPSRWRNRKPSS